MVGYREYIDQTKSYIYNIKFDIWNIANKTNEIVATVMLSPRTQLEYMNLFRAKGAKINVVSNNVQE